MEAGSPRRACYTSGSRRCIKVQVFAWKKLPIRKPILLRVTAYRGALHCMAGRHYTGTDRNRSWSPRNVYTTGVRSADARRAPSHTDPPWLYLMLSLLVEGNQVPY